MGDFDVGARVYTQSEWEKIVADRNDADLSAQLSRDATEIWKARAEDAIKTLESIANADYRGNRSGESVAAHLFLVSIGRRT